MFFVSGCTDIGKKRVINQDSFVFEEQGACLWVVICDGLGGENAGEVASSVAVSAANEFLRQRVARITSQQKAKNLVVESVKMANEAVIAKSKTDARFEGMSTTIVSLIFYDGMFHVANIGDSRAYLVRGDKVSQLTQDHSMVQVLIDSGKLSKSQAKKHPNRNCLVKVLGLDKDVTPSYCCQELVCGDKIIACTDGLHNYVSDEDIISVTSKFAVEQATKEFVNIALKRGGADNITVVLVHNPEVGE